MNRIPDEDLAEVRQAMVSARSVLHTALGDTPAELAKPERKSVLWIRIASLNRAIAFHDAEVAALREAYAEIDRLRGLGLISVYEINDTPGYQFELAWSDSDGERFSVDITDADDLLESIRDILKGEK